MGGGGEASGKRRVEQRRLGIKPGMAIRGSSPIKERFLAWSDSDQRSGVFGLKSNPANVLPPSETAAE